MLAADPDTRISYKCCRANMMLLELCSRNTPGWRSRFVIEAADLTPHVRMRQVRAHWQRYIAIESQNEVTLHDGFPGRVSRLEIVREVES